MQRPSLSVWQLGGCSVSEPPLCTGPEPAPTNPMGLGLEQLSCPAQGLSAALPGMLCVHSLADTPIWMQFQVSGDVLCLLDPIFNQPVQQQMFLDVRWHRSTRFFRTVILSVLDLSEMSIPALCSCWIIHLSCRYQQTLLCC